MRFAITAKNDRYEVYDIRPYSWGYGIRVLLRGGGVSVDLLSWDRGANHLARLRASELGLTEREIAQLPAYIRQVLPVADGVADEIESGLRRERRLAAANTRNTFPTGHFLSCGGAGVELCNPDGGRVFQVPSKHRRVAVGRHARRLLTASLAVRAPVDGVRQTLCRWPAQLV